MKKIILFLTTLLIISSFVSFDTYAAKNDIENKSNEIIQQTEDELFSAIDNNTKQALDYFGIDSLDFDKIYSFSLKNIGEFFSDTFKEKLDEVLKTFLMLCGVLLILYAAKTVMTYSGDSDLAETMCSLFLIMLCVSKINPVINSVLSVINLSSKFILAFVPIYAGIIALCANPAAAVTYNTLVLAFAQGASAFSKGMASSIVGAFLALSICFSFNENINLQRFCSAFNRITSAALGILSSMFALVLSVKGIMSAGVDSLSSKGIKLLVSSTVPVIGSAISQAYGTIIGSLSLIKSSVAVVGIVVCLVINLPVLIFSLLHYASFETVSFVAQASGFTRVSNVLKAFCSAIRFLMLVEVFEFIIVVISTGLMLYMKAGV